MPDFARLNQVFHCPRDVFHRHFGVGPVLVEQVDDLDPQPFQRSLRHALNLLRAAVHPGLGTGALFAVFEPELGGDDHLAAERFQGFADQLLVRERPIDLRRIEKGHTVLDRLVHKGQHFLFVGRLIAKAHPHTAQPQG